MAETLKKVRKQFVERVSEDMIRQLVDDLLEDRIVNDGESESILKDSNRTQQARCLINAVIKKGDGASRKMIAYLQERDPTLSETLDLAPPPQAAPARAEQRWSDTLIPCSEAFWREKREKMEDEIYPVSKESVRSRVALLITNIRFSDPQHNRAGAETDHKNMEKLLGDLGYEVVKYTDKTAKEMDAAVADFSKHPKLKETDSVFVVMMSHGKRDFVLGVEHTAAKPDEFPIDNIFRHLDSARCPALLGKPKIIIIQACRGKLDGSVLVKDDDVSSDDVSSDDFCPPGPSSGEDDITDDVVRCVPIEKDFICILSCTPDCLSYRHTSLGAFLIQYIVEVFKTFAHKEDIKNLFQRVTRRCEGFAANNKRQIPTTDRCSMTKDFYLFPGL